MRCRWDAFFQAVVSISLVLSCSKTESAKWEQPALIQLPVAGQPFDLNQFNRQVKPYASNKFHNHSRDGVTCSGCVSVDIGPIGLDSDVGPNDPPTADRVVARIINRDKNNKNEKRYGFQPDAKADYYIWLTKDPSPPAGKSQTKWTLVEIAKQGGSATVRYVEQGWEKECGPGSGESDADFKSCDEAHPPASSTNRSELLSFAALKKLIGWVTQDDTSRTSATDPAWLRCKQGCCTAATM